MLFVVVSPRYCGCKNLFSVNAVNYPLSFQISKGSCQVMSYASSYICVSFLDRDLNDRQDKIETVPSLRLLIPPS